jgi:hypothetical protein
MPSELLSQLGLVAGASVVSGLRLYGAVAALGLLHRLGVLALPGGLEVLSETPVLVLAGSLYLVEFIADKIPVVDSVWDAVHTFIRVPAAAVLAFAAFGDVAEPWRTGAALLCGTIALSAHGLKAGARLAINTSPEPLTNWAASFSEEILAAVLIWLAVTHPVAAGLVALGVLAVAVALAAWLARVFRRLLTRRSAEPTGTGT